MKERPFGDNSEYYQEDHPNYLRAVEVVYKDREDGLLIGEINQAATYYHNEPISGQSYVVLLENPDGTTYEAGVHFSHVYNGGHQLPNPLKG